MMTKSLIESNNLQIFLFTLLGLYFATFIYDFSKILLFKFIGFDEENFRDQLSLLFIIIILIYISLTFITIKAKAD